MIFTPLPLAGSYVIDVDPFQDERGWFARFFSKDEFQKIGHQKEWVQLNHSVTKTAGAIRGMHFQSPPFAEIKMVKCIVGSVFDVIIDLRKESPTFLQWQGVELSAANKKMMYIPQGFAHGFQSLTDDCQLIYHHTEFYNPQAEAGIRYNDERVGINWPLVVTMLSGRDAAHPLVNENFKGI